MTTSVPTLRKNQQVYNVNNCVSQFNFKYLSDNDQLMIKYPRNV